jgi:hypothetical protein
MSKPMIDPEALISLFEQATAKQGAQLRKAAGDATLAALQGRELSMKNIRAAIKSVSEAASQGVAKNMVQGVDAEALLDKAVAGMDDALLKAVEANQKALSTLAAQGASLREGHLQKALAELEKMEDNLFATLKKTAASAASTPMAGAWGSVLEKMQAQGTLSGAQAAATAQEMAEQMQAAVRSSRAAGMRAAQVMAESYAAMVSGVLLGMSEALQTTAPAKKAAKK